MLFVNVIEMGLGKKNFLLIIWLHDGDGLSGSDKRGKK